MKTIVIKNEDKQTPIKVRWTRAQKLFTAWTILNVILSVCLSLYAIFSKWGNSVIASVWLALLGLSVLVFTTMILLSIRDAEKFNARLKDYLAGIKILTKISNLINILMTLSILLAAYFAGDMSATATITTVAILLLFTLIGLIITIQSTIKRHKQS